MTEHSPAAPPPDPPPAPGADTWFDGYLPYLELIPNASVIFIAAAFFLSVLAFMKSRHNDRSSVFLALRSDYSRILETLHRDAPEYDSPHPLTGYASLPADAKKALRGYWVHSLNEFVISNILHPRDALKLWRDFYARAQSTALDMPLLRAALDDLILDENYSFGGHKEAYLSALERAYAAHRPGTVEVPRRRKGVEDPPSAARDAADTAALSRQILRRLRNRLDARRLDDPFRELIDEAETLCSAEDSAAYQAECLAACLALEAAAEGDFGVGAVLADADWTILGMARNTVFSSGDTSCHAEMNIISDHHIGRPGQVVHDAAMDGITLISSLEPCPMCLSRISMTPLHRIIYLAPDPGGGMVEKKEHLPEVWRGFLGDKAFRPTDHPSLTAFAGKVFEMTREKDAQFRQ
jgi:tRNA(Arg) A34 adenosine deaminase TadA